MILKSMILIIMSSFIFGCNSNLHNIPANTECTKEMLNYLMEGFSKKYPNLYCDDILSSSQSRLRQLITSLGYSDFMNALRVKGNGDIFWIYKVYKDIKLPYDDVLILSTTSPPQIKRMYHSTIYNGPPARPCT